MSLKVAHATFVPLAMLRSAVVAANVGAVSTKEMSSPSMVVLTAVHRSLGFG